MSIQQRILQELTAARERIKGKNVVVGLDGFVDTIVTPVAQRTGQGDSFTAIETITEFGQRVLSAAGKSTNIEFYPRMEKLGGNGPIMANALLAAGTTLTYLGALGKDNIHPIFADMATRSRIVSLCDPAATTAVEFDDGKLMLGQMKSLDEITFARLIEALGEDGLLKLLGTADLVALVNWTMIPNMTGIFDGIARHIPPNLPPPPPPSPAASSSLTSPTPKNAPSTTSSPPSKPSPTSNTTAPSPSASTSRKPSKFTPPSASASTKATTNKTSATWPPPSAKNSPSPPSSSTPAPPPPAPPPTATTGCPAPSAKNPSSPPAQATTSTPASPPANSSASAPKPASASASAPPATTSAAPTAPTSPTSKQSSPAGVKSLTFFSTKPLHHVPLKKHKPTGKLISLEGPEGCGKSTQVARLAKHIQLLGRDVFCTREPGGTEIGELIRNIIVHNSKGDEMCAETELLLFAAARAQLVRQIIVPRLLRGQTVISDRYLDSSTVYQGVARNLAMDPVNFINHFAVGNVMPDLTIILDVTPEVSLDRIHRRASDLPDRMERQNIDFYHKVREGYLFLAQNLPRAFLVIDGTKSEDEVAKLIWDEVLKLITNTEPAEPKPTDFLTANGH